MRCGVLLACVLTLTGCQDRVEPDPFATRIGQYCTIQFRRGDVLGAAGDLPVEPMTSGINGAKVALEGELVSVDNAWVTIVVDETEYWVPREAILSLSFQRVEESE